MKKLKRNNSWIMFMILFLLTGNGMISQKIDTLHYKFGKADFVFRGQRMLIKRQFVKEKAFKLVQNIARVLTFHLPLINNRRLNEAAWEHSVDQAIYGKIGHWNFGERSEKWLFFGENCISGYPSAVADYVLWFKSEGHRKNMFSYSFFSEGISFVKIKTYEQDFNYSENSTSSVSLAENQLNYYGTQVFK